MIVISVGSDRDLFKQTSAVRQRVAALATTTDNLNVIVFTRRRDRLSAFTAGRLRVYPTDSFSRLFYVWDAYRLARRLSRPDLITAQDPFECGLAAWLGARFWRAKLELQIHTDIGSPAFRRFSLANRIRFWLARFLLPRADRVRVVSQRIKDFLISNFKFPISKIEIRPIAVDTESIKKAPVSVDLHQKYPRFKKIILLASRLAPEKRIDLAIQAMSEVVKTRPDVGLVIVGSGPELSRLQLKTKTYNLQPNVVFEPWAERATLISYFKTADLFLQTSAYEGYGLALVEATTAGCPVVSTDVGVAREFGARIVEPKPAAIAAGILSVL